MIDLFLLLTPLLLLGVVALLGFAGCQFHAAGSPPTISIDPASGPATGGTAVAITASDKFFANNNSAMVTFGTAAAVPGTYMSTTVINALTPPQAAGAVPVQVDFTTADGQSLSISLPDGSSFTYTPVAPLAVVPLLPPVLSRNTTTAVTTNTVALGAFPGTKLVIVTVQWGSQGGASLSSITAPGVTFTQIGPTDLLNPVQLSVATFYAIADLTSGLTVTATLNGGSTSDFNLLVSAYDNAAAGAPVLPGHNQGTGPTPTPSDVLQTSTLAVGDLIYGVAIARGGGGALKGAWSPGPPFAGQLGVGDYLLLETYVLQQADIATGTISVTATDGDAVALSRWYIFAMAIQHS